MLNTKGKQRQGRRRLTCCLLVALILGAGLLVGCSNIAAEAQSLDRKGDLAGASALYQEALKQHPNDINILTPLAADLMLLGKFDEALPIQERVVALNPKDVQTQIELAFNYLNHQNQPAKAVLHLVQAVAVDPSAKNLTFMAQAQIQAGDSAGAEKSLGKATKTDPKYAFSYVVLIGLLQKQHRTDEAAQVRAQALQQGIDPKSLPQIAS